MRGPDEDGGGCGQYQEEILNYYREADPWLTPPGVDTDMESWKAYLKEKYGEEVCVESPRLRPLHDSDPCP